MTPSERAVIDAALKLITDCQADLTRYLIPDSGVNECDVIQKLLGRLDGPQWREVEALYRALPRPLSEQLAELRAGDVVISGHSETPRLVVANDVEAQKLWLRDAHRADQQPEPRMYRDIRRIISNPEESNG